MDVLSSVIVVSSFAILPVKRYHIVFPLLSMEMGRFLVSKKKKICRVHGTVAFICNWRSSAVCVVVSDGCLDPLPLPH
jgi:hypothetical protein